LIVTQKDIENDTDEIFSAWINKGRAVKIAMDSLKTEQDAKIAEEKVYYDRVIKPVEDIGVELAKNNAPKAIRDAVSRAGSVEEAIAASKGYLQTGTGDMGAYLFSSRQSEANGLVPPSFDAWMAAKEQQQLDREMYKLQQSEGIKFSYSLALQRAKEKITNAPPPNYNGEFAATIKLAAQAGGTNAQRTQIKNDLEGFISEGDYKSAYTQILSSASQKLTGANASNFQQQLQSYGALKDMREALKEFQAAGGNTNIFKGGIDKIQTKIGILATDAKYAAVATRLNSAFQQYRQNMTGAAFGVKESAEYASVLPSAGNTFSLNMAKIEGASQYLNSVVDNTVKNTVGEGGIYIKEYAEAGTTAQQQQENKQQKLSDFRAASPENEDLVQEIHRQFPQMTLDQVAEELGL